ncbi:MAG: DUF1329 domain-containing protein [Nevskia sp.]|nr:DUF1329 domain-containing protein [Nevskia sp.]
MLHTRVRAVFAFSFLCATASAWAGVSADEAARLGKDLTYVGSTRAGNADGTIPEYTGSTNFDVDLPVLYKGTKLTPRNISRQVLVDLWDQYKDFQKNGPPELRKMLDDGVAGEPKDIRGRLEAAQKDVVANWKKYYTELSPDYKQRLNDLRKTFVLVGHENLNTDPEKASEEQINALLALFKQQLSQVLGKLNNADQPLYTITPANMAQYADKLSQGHQALFKAYPDYKMVVYPSIRTAFFPDAVNEATVKNATAAHLEGTDNVLDAKLGFPFPIPKNGAEVMWNHKLRFRGSAARRYNDQAIVKPDGSFVITKLQEDVKFKYANLREPPAPGNKIFAFYLSQVLSPPRVAGEIILAHEPFIGNRAAWIYDPGLGRVNRAPDVGYDNPYPGTDGEQLTDQVDMFNGALDRYDWKLLGKKDLLIPYNSFLINGPAFTYKTLLTPFHINQKNSRYELHRVWVVEADLKPNVRHVFKKRVFYIDEDSWAIAVVENYDNRDQLWKVQEGHLLTAPFIPTVSALPELIYDLQSKRYFATTLTNEAQILDFNITFEDSHFDPANLRRLGQNH